MIDRQADLGERAGAEQRVGAFAQGERDDHVLHGRSLRAVDGRHAERIERHEEAVVLAAPVDQAVATGVRDEHVAAAAAVDEVLVRRARVGAAVRAVDRVQVVVRVHDVVAHAAEERVAPGAADEPVVAGVAEQVVVPVGRDGGIGRADEPLRVERPVGRVEVQEPVEVRAGLVLRQRLGRRVDRAGVQRARARRQQDLAERVVRVVLRLVGERRAVAEHVAGVERMVPVGPNVGLEQVAVRVVVVRVRLDGSLGAGHCVVAGAAVDRVVAEAAVDDVVRVLRRRAEVVRDQEGRVDQRSDRVDDDLLARALRGQRRRQAVGRVGERGDPVQRLGRALGAREDAAVVAEDAVVAVPAGDPVVAAATDDRVVLPVAVDDVVARAAVEEVVAGLAVDLARATDDERRVGVAFQVVDQRDPTRDDVGAVVEAQEAARPDEVEDEPVVRDDRVGVVRVAVRRRVADVVVRDRGAGAAEEQVRAVRPHRLRRLAEQVRAAADDVVLAEVPEDRVVAGAAEDHVASTAVRPQIRRGEAEEAGAAADDIVLALAAEDQIAAAAALDVVVAVGGEAVDRRVDEERVRRVAAGADEVREQRVQRADGAGVPARERRGRDDVDGAVALDDVVAVLAEDDVVARAAREVVVTGGACGRARADVDEGHPEVAPPARALGVDLPRGAGVRHAGRQVVDLAAAQLAEERARDVAEGRRAVERRVVAEDEVVARAAVDHVVAGLAEQDVCAVVAVDRVVAALRVERQLRTMVRKS